MFLARRPSPLAIDRFLRESHDLPTSYGPVGLVKEVCPDRRVDEEVVAIGHGREDFERARAALMTWKQCDIGWLQVFPQRTPVAVGTIVAVLIRHLGFWSLNGCRVVYDVGGPSDTRFGYAHGTLVNHAEAGEEIFEVFIDGKTGNVMYRIRAASWARSPLAWLGQPVVRLLQAQFRRDSVEAMRRAVRLRN